MEIPDVSKASGTTFGKPLSGDSASCKDACDAENGLRLCPVRPSKKQLSIAG